MNQKLILVVDDNQDNRVILSAILTHHGYSVLQAVDGQGAIDQASRHAPDAILMDLQMPVLDGWEAARLLKAEPETASIPIIAVTAQDHDSSLGRLQQAGFSGYIKKTFLPRIAVQAVESCLQGVTERKLWIDLPAFEGSRSPKHSN